MLARRPGGRRPAVARTPELEREIERLASCQVKQIDIATQLGVSQSTVSRVIAALAVVLATPALSAGLCADAASVKAAVEAKGGAWIELAPEQWQFLRGIYAMNPLTPPGLPYGDKAVLAKEKAAAAGQVLFIDGDKACTPMPVPKPLMDMLDDVILGTIPHEGDKL